MPRPPRLASTELAVMQLLWSQGASTAREIMEALYPDARTSQHGTVQSILQRLEEKHLVTRDRSQHVQRFSARINQDAYTIEALESLASDLTDGSLAPLVTHLINEKLSAAEIEELKRILEEK